MHDYFLFLWIFCYVVFLRASGQKVALEVFRRIFDKIKFVLNFQNSTSYCGAFLSSHSSGLFLGQLLVSCCLLWQHVEVSYCMCLRHFPSPCQNTNMCKNKTPNWGLKVSHWRSPEYLSVCWLWGHMHTHTYRSWHPTKQTNAVM